MVGRESPLNLTKLEKLSDLNETTFADIPIAMRLAFLKRMLRVTALSDKSDLDLRFDLFERLNTGGVALSPQEVRSCVYKGKLSDELKSLTADPDFSGLLKLQEKRQADGTREEQVLKFFAYLETRNEFKGAVKKFLNDYSKSISSAKDFSARASTFKKAVQALGAVIDGPFLRPGLYITPLNQFEAVLVASAEELEVSEVPFNPQPGWLVDEELVRSSTGATNTKTMLEARISRARALLRGADVKPSRDVPNEDEVESEL